jgi:hypothetical protein
MEARGSHFWRQCNCLFLHILGGSPSGNGTPSTGGPPLQPSLNSRVQDLPSSSGSNGRHVGSINAQWSQQILSRLIPDDNNLNMQDIFDASTQDDVATANWGSESPWSSLCDFGAEFCWDLLMRLSPLALFSTTVPNATDNWEFVLFLIRASPLVRPKNDLMEHEHAPLIHAIVERIVCLSHVWGSCSNEKLFAVLFKWLFRDRTTQELLHNRAGTGQRSVWEYRHFHLPGNSDIHRIKGDPAASGCDCVFPYLEKCPQLTCCASRLPKFLLDYGKFGATFFNKQSSLLPAYGDSASCLMCKLLQIHVPKLKAAARSRVTRLLLQLLPKEPLVVQHFPLDDVCAEQKITDWRNATVPAASAAANAPHEASANNMLKLAHMVAMQATLTLATLLSDKLALDSTSRRWLKKRTVEFASLLDHNKSTLEAAAVVSQGQWLMCCIYQDVNCHFGGAGEPALGLVDMLRHAANSFDEMDKGTPGLKVSICVLVLKKCFLV